MDTMPSDSSPDGIPGAPPPTPWTHRVAQRWPALAAASVAALPMIAVLSIGKTLDFPTVLGTYLAGWLLPAVALLRAASPKPARDGLAAGVVHAVAFGGVVGSIAATWTPNVENPETPWPLFAIAWIVLAGLAIGLGATAGVVANAASSRGALMALAALGIAAAGLLFVLNTGIVAVLVAVGVGLPGLALWIARRRPPVSAS